MGQERHFPDVDEYVWLIESSDDGARWWPWSREQLPGGGLAPWDSFTVDIHRALADVLTAWFAAAAQAQMELEDTWVRASAWRLGRIVDGLQVRTTPAHVESPETYGRWLYANTIAPDVVEVRTPYEAVRLVDAAHAQPSAGPRPPVAAS
jgi:hypothetical protein